MHRLLGLLHNILFLLCDLDPGPLKVRRRAINRSLQSLHL